MYGAYSNAWTSTDYLAYIRECPDFDWERILRQLVVQVTSPKFLLKEFKAEVGNVEEEMRLRSNEKWDEIYHVMETKFGKRYTDTWLGRLELMKNVQLNDINEHYHRTHGAKNLTFFIAGDMEGGKKNKITDILEDLSRLPNTPRFKLYKEPKVSSYDKPVVIPKKDVDNVYLKLKTYASSELSQSSVIANLTVLNKLLDDGDHSRIYGKARQRGLVYSLGCGRGVNEHGTYYWVLSCQVGNNNIDKLIDLIIKELKKVITKGFTKKEIREAVTSIKGGLRMNNQTSYSILDWHAAWYTSTEQEKVYDFDQVDKWYDEVTPESIQKLFLNLIKTKKWGAGFLGNVDEAQAQKWNKKLAEIFED